MADVLLLTKTKTPETGYEPAPDGGYDSLEAALDAAEDWARSNPTRPALVEMSGTNEAWSVVYREGEVTVARDADGVEVRGSNPGVLEVVADLRERTVLAIEDSDEFPGRKVITEAAGQEGDHAAWFKYDVGHPGIPEGAKAGEVVPA